MEEILASIRRIIADDEAAKPSPKAAEPQAAQPAPIAPDPAAEPAAMSQHDIDAMLAGFEVAVEEPAHAPVAPAEEAPDVLELTPAMEAEPEPEPSPSFRTIEAAADVVFTDPSPEPPRTSAVAQPFPDQRPAQALLSDDATASVASAFGSLAHTVLVQNARTLDDLVREMLRPMLKSWLDDNLPTIVERLVRAEIERVSRGRG